MMDQPPVNDISYNWFLEQDKLMGASCENCGAHQFILFQKPIIGNIVYRRLIHHFISSPK